MPNERRVKIFIEDGVCQADPGVQHVKREDRVVLEAIDTDVLITFPETELFGWKLPHKKLKARGTRAEWRLKVRRDVKQGEEYEYTIFCKDTRRYVDVASSPKFIVDE